MGPLILRWINGLNPYQNIVTPPHSLRPDLSCDQYTVRQTSFESSADPVFVRQSIYLHANYHKVKMWVRRPYTLPSRKDSPLAPAATAMCTSSAVACLSTLYKCRYQLDVDILHHEVPSLSSCHGGPELTSVNVSGLDFYDGLHLSHQHIEPASIGRHHSRQGATRKVFEVARDYGKEVPYGRHTFVRPSDSWSSWCSFAL